MEVLKVTGELEHAQKSIAIPRDTVAKPIALLQQATAPNDVRTATCHVQVPGIFEHLPREVASLSLLCCACLVH